MQFSDDRKQTSVFLVPHAGGGASTMRDLAMLLQADACPVGVRLPGRESRMAELPLTDIGEIADEIAPLIDATYADGNRILYGHCFGAFVAYEVARRLEIRAGDALVVSAQPAPSCFRARGAWKLESPAFFAAVAADGYLPAELQASDELLRLVEPALRGDYQAADSYHCPSEPLEIPIVAIRGRDDGSVAEGEMAAWSELTSDHFEYVSVAAGHNLLQESAKTVGEILVGTIRARRRA